ncbi:MAG: CinA family protein [Micrococcales bacterium]|nr:CinA family protein [Micrococcales bacterium]
MTLPAAGLVAALRAAGLTVGAAESLTGGLVCGALTDVPGASAVVRGGVVSYATQVKATVLGVPEGLLAERGAVDADVAAAMAEGVCRVLACDVGLATTGVAGPDPQDGQPVGTVFVAVCVRGETTVERLAIEGDRPAIRQATVAAVLALAGRRLPV